jgi:glycerol-3-phosphate acyltransferase PlsX
MRARVALDTMGGDSGPAAAVRAACALSLATDIETILVGDEADLQNLLDGQPYDPAQVTVRHAASWVSPDEDPQRAMRRKKRNSLAIAGSMVGEGEADALVTGGNRQACLLTVQKFFRRLPGIVPGFGFVFAGGANRRARNSLSLLIDGGATEQCRPEDLTAFAAMGAVYVRAVSLLPRPRVGFLPSGEAPGRAANHPDALAATLAVSADFEFVGTLREMDLSAGVADVIICEGLVGRRAICGIEDRAAEIPSGSDQYERSIWRRRPWAPSGTNPRSLVDVTTYGGSPALGFSQVCLHVHRQSETPALRNAVVQAAQLVRGGLAESTRQAVAALR